MYLTVTNVYDQIFSTLVQIYGLPSWQSSFVNEYFQIVDGTSEQPYTTTNVVASDGYYDDYIHEENVGVYNAQGCIYF